MYTLRIIDQSKDGVEERRNTYLGNSYNVVMKVPIREDVILKVDESRFNIALADFHGILRENIERDIESVDDTIIGFIYADSIHPLRKNEVVYILNNEGKTIERVCGLYEKY